MNDLVCVSQNLTFGLDPASRVKIYLFFDFRILHDILENLMYNT